MPSEYIRSQMENLPNPPLDYEVIGIFRSMDVEDIPSGSSARALGNSFDSEFGAAPLKATFTSTAVSHYYRVVSGNLEVVFVNNSTHNQDGHIGFLEFGLLEG